MPSTTRTVLLPLILSCTFPSCECIYKCTEPLCHENWHAYMHACTQHKRAHLLITSLYNCLKQVRITTPGKQTRSLFSWFLSHLETPQAWAQNDGTHKSSSASLQSHTKQEKANFPYLIWAFNLLIQMMLTSDVRAHKARGDWPLEKPPQNGLMDVWPSTLFSGNSGT